MSYLNLNQLQQWVTGQLLQNHTHDPYIEKEIKTQGDLNATQRLNIYQTGYKLRLLECMKAEFQTLYTFLGNDLFELFALGYIQRHPSQSYTLYTLGEGFSEFLCQTKPPTEEKNLLIPEQLAKLEHYQALSMRGKGCEQQEQVLPSEIDLLMGDPLPSLALPDTSFLVSCDFDLFSYVKAVQQGETPPIPAQVSQTLLIYRHHYRVDLVVLEPWQTCIIQGVKDKNPHLLHAVAQQNQLTIGEVLAKFSLWLPSALALSYLMIEND